MYLKIHINLISNYRIKYQCWPFFLPNGYKPLYLYKVKYESSFTLHYRDGIFILL